MTRLNFWRIKQAENIIKMSDGHCENCNRELIWWKNRIEKLKKQDKEVNIYD